MRAAAIAASVPPHMADSVPFSAPACPPETGASTQSNPRFSASSKSWRAIRAETVVWSMNNVPLPIVLKAPSGPSVTEARSSSLPTQVMTISAFWAACAGVAAIFPLYFSTQSLAFAMVRLNTTRSCPAFVRCPAMGPPMTPSPINAIFAIGGA